MCQKLLQRQEKVIGIDNLNHYYDVRLKEARLAKLQTQPHFKFYKIDIANKTEFDDFIKENSHITQIVHLAAQAGVRYSLTNPFAYTEANVVGHLAILEACRKLPIKHLVYAAAHLYTAQIKSCHFQLTTRLINLFHCMLPQSVVRN